MARTLDEIIEQEKQGVVLQANEKAKKIIKDIDEKAEASAEVSNQAADYEVSTKLSHVKVLG